jgi:hypothetical protein
MKQFSGTSDYFLKNSALSIILATFKLITKGENFPTARSEVIDT